MDHIKNMVSFEDLMTYQMDTPMPKNAILTPQDEEENNDKLNKEYFDI